MSSTAHPGSSASPGTRAKIRPLAGENRLIRRVLLTGLQPAGSPLSWLIGSKGKDHFS